MNKLSKQAEIELVKLLARHQAPWQPVRRDWDHAPNIYAARQAGGVFGMERLDANARKQRERAIDVLTSRRLLVSSKVFTVEGKRLARSWTYPYDTDLLCQALHRIAKQLAADNCRHSELVPETFISGAKWGASVQPFAALQAMLLPLLCDGVVEAESTCHGHTYYRLSDSLGDAIQAAKSLLNRDVENRDDLLDVYLSTYATARRELLDDDEQHQDIGILPLPLTDSLNSDRDDNDMRHIKTLFPPSFF